MRHPSLRRSAIPWVVPVLALVLTSMAGAPASGAGDQRPAEIQRTLDKLEAALAASDWERAENEASKMIEDMVELGAHGEVARGDFAHAFSRRAIAEIALHRMPEARWDWESARLLAGQPLASAQERYGESTQRLEEESLRLRDRLREVPHIESLDEGFEAPRRISGETPDFPEAARLTRVRRHFEIELVIDEFGFPRSPELESKRRLEKDTDFVAECLDVLRGWRFEPARWKGEPFPVKLNQTFDFELR